MKTSAARSLFSSQKNLALVLLFALALAIRLYDLTDLPLDFHPTRQLISAIKARGMYYQGRADVPDWQRPFAVQQWKSRAEIEPEIVERLVAVTYRFTGEQLWLGRVYSSLFWLIGGVFLYLLLGRLTSQDGALLGTAFYLFLPYAVIASRSFQPDPLMVMLTIVFWWAVYRWGETPEPQPRATKTKKPSRSSFLHGEDPWAWAIAAGLLGGLAILVKFSAAFFVIGGALGALLGHTSIRKAVRDPQVWVMAVLGLLPGAAYLIYGVFVAGFLGQQFSGRFIPALLISPSYYLNWLSTLNHVLGAAALALALLGTFFFRERSVLVPRQRGARIFAVSLWAAYALYGLCFNYHIWSHDYYNLPLIPLAALSLAPLLDAGMARLTETVDGSRAQRAAAVWILALGLVAVMIDVRAALKDADYRPAAAFWSGIGESLDSEARVVALTDDYGLSLAYWGWLDSAAWPLTGDITYHADLRGAQDDFEARFSRLALKRDFFLITSLTELDQQPVLQERLAAYPIFAQGADYVIYDLR